MKISKKLIIFLTLMGLTIIFFFIFYSSFNANDRHQELIRGLSFLFFITTLIVLICYFFNIKIKSLKSLYVPFIVIGLALGLTTSLSIILEYVPVSDTKEIFDINGLSGIINREDSIQIPLRNALEPYKSNITLFLYTLPKNTSVEGIKLSTSSDSILSYQGNFVECKNNNLTNAKCYETTLKAQHDLSVSNTTVPFVIKIFYSNITDADNTTIHSIDIPFNWSVNTIDMTLFSYFWIVMIGVIVSRLLSLTIEKLKEQKAKGAASPLHVEVKDIIWIGFSFIIALLIFQSFNSQVHLSFSIMTNITLAFAFGFGFDKTLEVAKNFKDI